MKKLSGPELEIKRLKSAVKAYVNFDPTLYRLDASLKIFLLRCKIHNVLEQVRRNIKRYKYNDEKLNAKLLETDIFYSNTFKE